MICTCNHTLLCLPCQQHSRCLFMTVFCLLFSFRTSLIYPAELQSKNPSELPAAVLHSLILGCRASLRTRDGLCPASVLHRTIPAAIRPSVSSQTNKHVLSLNEPLVLFHVGIDSEHLGSGRNQCNLFKSGITKSWVNLDLHKRFLAGRIISFLLGGKKDTTTQINNRELMMRGEYYHYVLTEMLWCLNAFFSCFYTGDLQLFQHQWWRAAGRGGGALPQVSDISACFALNIEQLWTLSVLLAKKSIVRFSD